jgi:hypothetical protein
MLRGKVNLGQLAYESNVLLHPFFPDGSRRHEWKYLPTWVRESWEKNPFHSPYAVVNNDRETGE